MLDYLIQGGTVVDGTGTPGRTADVGIRGDRIVAVGEVDEPAKETIDAGGLIVAPGFVDPHTHYDAQLHWDAYATPSSLHGVTSVIGGNCGFTLAPLKADDADYTRRMMAKVEGMPLQALEQGIDWSWETFAEYLDRLEGRIAVNAGFLVGHCALRRYVLGPEATERESSPEEVERLVRLLEDCLAAGGLGLSTSRSSTHNDGDNQPVPSRIASEAELLELCDVVSRYPGTTLEAILEGCLRGFSDAEVELMAQMSARANRPLNWNVLGVAAGQEERTAHQLRPSVRAAEIGGRVVALTMPIFADNNMSLGTFCALWLIPGWHDILSLPRDEKIAKLHDPAAREEMRAAAKGTAFDRLADFSNYRIGDTIAPENKRFEGRLITEIAAELGQDPADALVDITAADDFKTVLWPLPAGDGKDDWEARRRLWEHDTVLLGGSDAGAHLDRMLGSPYPTRFLSDCLRGRQLVSVERAIELMTDAPARLFGLTDRGRLIPGAFADIVVFDPETVDSGPARRVYDLPGESLRLTAESMGIERVFVNGRPAIISGQPVGELPGRVLRSGRDTETVATR
ncbi:MAG: D-aminoacylase [Actinomycetota bacterium]|nr:D-aminoacylase [Actinomycetota bacterium]